MNKEVRYADLPMEAFEEQIRQTYPAWLAVDVRLMFQGYQDRGFVPSKADVATLTSLIGHALIRSRHRYVASNLFRLT